MLYKAKLKIEYVGWHRPDAYEVRIFSRTADCHMLRLFYFMTACAGLTLFALTHPSVHFNRCSHQGSGHFRPNSTFLRSIRYHCKLSENPVGHRVQSGAWPGIVPVDCAAKVVNGTLTFTRLQERRFLVQNRMDSVFFFLRHIKTSSSFATFVTSDVETWASIVAPACIAFSPAIYQAGKISDPFSERWSGWVEAQYDVQAISHVCSEESHASRLNREVGADLE